METRPGNIEKGRGAVNNPRGRFESVATVPFDDGWGTLEREPLPPLKTSVADDHSKSIIATNQSPDIPFDQSINPYRGCEHGCIYCYARPSHAFYGHSPGLDFETKLYRKPRAAALLEQELRKPRYQCKVITLGANTDPYQPIERKHRITAGLLGVLADYRHPVAIITKGALVLRDKAILAQMAAQNLAHVIVSVTTMDPKLARVMEPRAASPLRRIQVIRELSAAGIPVSVNAAPLIPAINDGELEKILQTCAQAGARSATYILVRLPNEVTDLFQQWLATHFPDRADHVMSLIRQTRGGKTYRSGFGRRMRGTGPYADLLRKRFALACRRYHLNKRDLNLNTTLFKPPIRPGDQMNLFEV